MGRISVDIVVENVLDRDRRIESPALVDPALVDPALVDTCASYLTLPMAWREQMGDFEKDKSLEIELAYQHTTPGRLCGPVRIVIDGFDPVYSEVLFIEMSERDGSYEPLPGCIPMETGLLAVDLETHKLVSLKRAKVKQRCRS